MPCFFTVDRGIIFSLYYLVLKVLWRTVVFLRNATVAQLVEQLICNHQVGGSNPFGGSKKIFGW